MSKFNSNINTGNKSNGFTVRLSGVNDILRNLELTKNQTSRLQKFLIAEAEKIKRTAIELVPKDTLRLAESHRVESSRTFTGSKDVIAVDILVGGISIRGRFVDYAAAVHEGNPKHPIIHLRKPGRPWLARAAQMHAPGFESRLKKAVKIYGGR